VTLGKLPNYLLKIISVCPSFCSIAANIFASLNHRRIVRHPFKNSKFWVPYSPYYLVVLIAILLPVKLARILLFHFEYTKFILHLQSLDTFLSQMRSSAILPTYDDRKSEIYKSPQPLSLFPP
jgi:hypothetical protein